MEELPSLSCWVVPISKGLDLEFNHFCAAHEHAKVHSSRVLYVL